jgi:hypothetical protein
MSNIDKRNKLDEEIFTYRVTKDKTSEKFISRIQLASPKEAHLIMAKATGNFKHGNEKGVF